MKERIKTINALTRKSGEAFIVQIEAVWVIASCIWAVLFSAEVVSRGGSGPAL